MHAFPLFVRPLRQIPCQSFFVRVRIGAVGTSALIMSRTQRQTEMSFFHHHHWRSATRLLGAHSTRSRSYHAPSLRERSLLNSGTAHDACSVSQPAGVAFVDRVVARLLVCVSHECRGRASPMIRGSEHFRAFGSVVSCALCLR